MTPLAALASPEPLRTQPQALLTAAEVAARFGLSRDWVYEHASDLGVVRLGHGPRPRLRFNAETVAAALTRCTTHGRSEPEENRAAPGQRWGRRTREVAGAPGLLPFDTFNSSEFEKTVGPRRANDRPPATRIEPSPRPEPTPQNGLASGAAGRAPRATTERSQ